MTYQCRAETTGARNCQIWNVGSYYDVGNH